MKTRDEANVSVPLSGCQGTFRGAMVVIMSARSYMYLCGPCVCEPSALGIRKVARSSSYLRMGPTPSAVQMSTMALPIMPALLLAQVAPKGCVWSMKNSPSLPWTTSHGLWSGNTGQVRWNLRCLECRLVCLEELEQPECGR